MRTFFRKLLWTLFILGFFAGLIFLAFRDMKQDHSTVQASPRPSLRPSADNSEIQVYLDAIQAEGTLESARAQMTATQEVIDATATAHIANQHATQTQQARLDQRTATQRAWQAQQATMEADRSNATNTAQAAGHIATSTARAAGTQAAMQSTADTASINAVQTAQAAEAELANLAIQRERLMNKVAAVAPWALGIFVIVVIIAAVAYWLKIEADRRRVFRDANGNVTHIQRWERGRGTVVSTDRMSGPAIVLSEDGSVMTPGSDDVPQTAVTLLAMLAKLGIEPDDPLAQAALSAPKNMQLGPGDPDPQGEIIDVKVVDAEEDSSVGTWMDDVENEILKGDYLNK